MEKFMIFESPLILGLLISVIVLNIFCALFRKLFKDKKAGKILIPNLISIVTLIINGAIFAGFFLYRIYSPEGRAVSTEEILFILMLISAVALKTSYVEREGK